MVGTEHISYIAYQMLLVQYDEHFDRANGTKSDLEIGLRRTQRTIKDIRADKGIGNEDRAALAKGYCALIRLYRAAIGAAPKPIQLNLFDMISIAET